MFVGIILIVASAWWIVQGPHPTQLIPVREGTNLADFVTVVNGALPPFVFLLGIFIVWLELDELRIERELAAEERRARKRKRR
jgi:hypothetical protein